MHPPHLPDLLIEGYRGLRRLELKKLGHVNLIVGRNGVGKTSVLEAVRLYASAVEPDVLIEILVNRNEREADADPLHPFEREELHSIFTTGTALRPDAEVIRIGEPSAPLEISLGWVHLAKDSLGYSQYFYDPAKFDIPGPHNVAQAVRAERSGQVLRLVSFSRALMISGRDGLIQEPPSPQSIRRPAIFVGSTGVPEPQFGRFWDATLLAGNEDETIAAIQRIRPDISRIWMLGGGADSRRRIVARLGDQRKSVPLRSLGEGIYRFLALSCALVAAKDGFLLIDEFENGLHYTTQESLWKFIIQTARELNVQVFATTHSRDCIAAFGRATFDDKQSDGVLTKLVRQGDDIVARQLDEEDVLLATENLAEIR